MKRLIVTIMDNKAKDLVPQGYLMVHRHIATAARMYTDVAADPQSAIGQHIEDYDLVQLGWVTEDNTIEPAYEILISGKAYGAILKAPTSENTTQPQGR